MKDKIFVQSTSYTKQTILHCCFFSANHSHNQLHDELTRPANISSPRSWPGREGQWQARMSPGQSFWLPGTWSIPEGKTTSLHQPVSPDGLRKDGQSLTLDHLPLLIIYFLMVTITFGVAIVFRMVLGFFVKRNLQVLSNVLPLCRRWMLESGSQLDSKLETEGLKKLTIFFSVSVHCTCRYQRGIPNTWIWPQHLCTQSCWRCSSTRQVASHLNVRKGRREDGS